MHSSRMRTVHCSSNLLGGGGSARGGVCKGGGGVSGFHFFRLTKFHDISMISRFLVNFSRPAPGGEVEVSGLWGVSRPTPGGGLSQHALRQTPPAHGYCCGRYAPYWNAFLFSMFLTNLPNSYFTSVNSPMRNTLCKRQISF